MARASRYIKPKWSLYHINNNIEHDLAIDYIVEYNDIAGIKVNYWIYDETVTQDRLYGEAVNDGYIGPYESKMFYEEFEEPAMTTSFGMHGEDSISFYWMPKFTFSRDVSGSISPKIGDVIQTPWNERSFEIIQVHDEDKVFQLGKIAYNFIVKPFRFSEQSDSAKDISYDIDSTLTNPSSAFGDNEWLESESNEIYNYENEGVDKTIYGY